MDVLNGQIRNIEYREDSGPYCESTIGICKSGDELIRFVGFFKSIYFGETIKAKGRLIFKGTNHQLFEVSEYRLLPPTDHEQMISYLCDICESSREIMTVVVDRFKDQSIDILCRKPELLYEIPNFDRQKAQNIIEKWTAFNSTSSINVAADQMNLPANLVTALANLLPKDTDITKIIYKDPMLFYRSDILDWDTALEYARSIKANLKSLVFIRSALLYVLRMAWQNGETGLKVRNIYAWAHFLGIPDLNIHDLSESQKVKLLGDNIQFIDNRFYLTATLDQVKELAELLEMIDGPPAEISLALNHDISNTLFMQAADISSDLETKGWSYTKGLMNKECEAVLDSIHTGVNQSNLEILFAVPTGYKLKPWQEGKSFFYEDVFDGNACEWNRSNPIEETLLVMVEPLSLPLGKLNSLISGCKDSGILMTSATEVKHPQVTFALSVIGLSDLFGIMDLDGLVHEALIDINDKPCCVVTNNQYEDAKTMANAMREDGNKVVILDGFEVNYGERDITIHTPLKRPYLNRLSIASESPNLKFNWAVQNKQQYKLTESTTTILESAALFDKIMPEVIRFDETN